MNAMKNKIQSQRGASITFALLLFLVCAIISSVVIVAATAVGGRASQMAELDQRYYAVNSAAELLRDVLEAQTVTVTMGTKTEWKEDQNGVEVGDSRTITANAPSITLNDSTEPISDSSDYLILGAAVQLVKGNPASGSDEEKKAALESLPDIPALKPLTLEASGDGITESILDVNMTIQNVSDGKLHIKVSNADTSRGTYTLGMTFKSDIVQNKNKQKSQGAPEDPSLDEDGKIVFTRQVTENNTTVSTIKWKLIEMKIDKPDMLSPTETPEG